MALLTDIVRETSENFGLGNKAGALVAETIRIMFNPKLGGLKGFLDGFERAGLRELAQSWREGVGALKPLDGKQLESAVGTALITEAGRNLGLANARVRTAMAFVVPRLTRFFATGTDLPRTAPPAVEAFLASDEARIAAPSRRPLPRQKPRASRSWFWTVGVLVLLITGGLMGYQLWQNQQKLKDLAANPRQAAVAESPQQKPEPAPEPDKPPTRLVIRNDAGQFEFSGVVSDAGMRTSIIEQLLTFFGQPRLSGNLAIDPTVAVPGWLTRLDRVLPQLNVPGLDVRLEGNQVKLGGWLSEQDRESVMRSLKTALGPGFRFSYLRDEETELTEESQQQTLTALAALPPGYQSQDLLAILNRWVVPFPEDSAELPEEAKPILNRAADLLKGMAQPVIVEIGGHTDNLGKPADNLRVSQARAAAVREALIQAGVPVQMLQFKAYGREQPVASNDTPYGRFKNRRIEFKAVQLCDAAHPCGLPEPVAAPLLEPMGPVMLEKEEPPLPPLPDSRSTLAPDPGTALTEPAKPRKPKPRPKPSPSKDTSSPAESPPGTAGGAAAPKRSVSGSGSKSPAPTGGRWIPQLTKPAATQKSSPSKKTDSVTAKPKAKSPSAPSSPPKASTAPSTAPKPKPKPAERRPSTQDLF